MRAIQARFRPQAETTIPSLSSLRRFFVPLSSPSSSVSNPRVSNSIFDELDGSSGVYRHALKFQRPTTLKWRSDFQNFASFIGTVVKPLTPIENEYEYLRAYTFLSVRNSPHAKESCRILLYARDSMAEMCLKHLKVNDFIYVSGHLGTYTKADQNGNVALLFKVILVELNYVTRRHGSDSQNIEERQSGGLTVLERYRNRLHLWQVFFSSPYEWWDNRKGKVNPKVPDFKHKDTGEALWLSPNDPPWVKKQLQLLDSKMAEQGQGEPRGRRARVSKWEYDDKPQMTHW